MPEQNFQTFRGLLRGAICTRTQAQFANDCGISAAHLSRMLNDTTIHRPNNKTLHKIAAAAKNGITYEDLKKALDDEDPDFLPGSGSAEDREERSRMAADDFMPDFKERAAVTMKALCNTISKRTYPCVVEDVPAYLGQLIEEAVQQDSVCLPVSYEIDGDWPYITGVHSFASRWMSIELTMADLCETAASEMVIFYTEVAGASGNFYTAIQQVSTAVADISDVRGTPPCAMQAHREGPNALTDECDVFDAAMNDPFYLRFGETERLREKFVDAKATSEKELLLSSVFGRKTEYSETTFGVGFWLDGLPPKFLEYVQAHRDAILRPCLEEDEEYRAISQALDRAVEEDDPQIFVDELDEFQYLGSEDSLNDVGFGACIAASMESVTGFPFVYKTHTAPEENDMGFVALSDKDCVILPEARMRADGIQRETALLAIGRTIRELGLTSFGDLMFTRMETIYRKPHTYRPRIHPKTGQETGDEAAPLEDPDYSVLFSSGTLPEKTNVYAVKLKDGREVTLVYLKEQNIWLKRNKEWSHLIEAYDPRPLETKAADDEDIDDEEGSDE